jgi:hypothetical protein
MADFSAAQQKLADARKGSAAARTAASLAVQQQKAAATARDRFARSLDPRNEAAVARMAQLRAQAEEAAAEAARTRGLAQQAAFAAAAALGEFTQFTDPRQNVGQLSDASPFVLFPIRLETRFKQVSRDDAVRNQLWVRIYPDDCSIDTFEEALSATELANAQQYWQGIWRAGGIEDDERAAWRSLVAAHGSSRAGYIVDTYRPTNLPAPAKANRADEILAIPTQTALVAAEAAAISAYWQAVWLADGDGAQLQAARGALEATVGDARAGELVAAYQPFNLSDRPAPPLQKNAVAVSIAFVIFPPDPATRQSPWTQAPAVRHFPERFVVLGYNGGQQTLEAMGGVITLPLYVGPDPSADLTADPTSGIHPQNGDLFFPDELKWLVDFERAVAAGMGIVIDLTAEQARAGFDRLLVLGLQLSAQHVDGKAALEEMLHHHAVGRSGLTLVPQGTPTHNTTGKGTGYTRLDNADQSFDDRKDAPLFTLTSDPMQKRDGQWLGELLGIDVNLFTSVHASGGTDQMCVRAMQRALWPATLGYWMDKMLAPVFSDAVVANTRWFYTHFVSGCGPVPAIRIGGQPYGILPTTSFSRIRWLDAERPVFRPDPQLAFLRELFAVIRAVDADWTAMAASAASVGKDNDARDAHQLLLDVVGLHPSSVEFYSRYAESLSQLFNTLNLARIGPDFFQALIALALQAAATGLLARLGYSGPPPDILQLFFLEAANRITSVIDDRPLSETDTIRPYASGSNYIQWLIDAANQSLDAVRLEEGFDNEATPQALLYLYLRQALMLGYYDASYELHKSAGILTAVQLAAMKPEPRFVHVADAAPGAPSESRFAALYKTEPLITGSPTMRVSDYITLHLAFLIQTQGLREQLAALAVLAAAPTARLERAFAEHIDTCTYRLDAWLLGLVNYQLQQMRYGGGEAPQTGVYLGSYAWVENLRPDPTRLSPAQIPGDVAPTFAGTEPIMHDPRNGGYVHAPSLTHGRTAAVLRSGYLANATPNNPQTLKVDLSSDRVRIALSMLEGVRNGQSLGALLGYRFERELHDDYGLAEVDSFIYPLRKAFPLVADALGTTKTPADVSIEAIEARNVIDGRKLVAYLNTSNQTTYPFGLSGLPAADATNATATQAISAAANRLRDVYDAISDLALAEGVHQAVQGNFERIGATLNAYSSGNFPPDPEVVQTGPAGNALTHRVAIHFPVGLAAPADPTPRARAEPALDAFVESLLPPLDQIGCVVTWTDPGGAARKQEVTLADLALRPIDVAALIKPDQVQMMTELDDRVLRFVLATASPRPDVVLKIGYMLAPAGKLSIFAVTALVRSINALVNGARPLRATDGMLDNDARPDQNANVFADATRISGPKADLDTLSADITTFLGTLAPLIADPVANRAAIVAGIDGFIDTAAALIERAARFNLPQSGWGFVYAWRQRAVGDLLRQVRALVTRWDAKLADFDVRITAYDALPAATDDVERFKALHAAELVIVAQVDPPPATPAALRTLLDTKRADFQARRDGFAAVLASAGTSFTGFLAAATALLPITQFDRAPFDLAPFGDRAIVMAEDLAANLKGHLAAIDKRRDATKTALDAGATATSQAAQGAAVAAAAQALLGEEFRIFPEFALTATQADEWANAVNQSTGGALLNFLTTSGIDLPVDEWLCGAARVRPMLRAFEATVALTGALGGTEPSLLPIQLPYDATASWLALQFPPDPPVTSDRLLYTAHYMTPFDKTVRQCGLLLDEWSEVLPATTRTTGITFNFKRSDNEPPQSILLVTPASATGRWEWADLVGALNETLDLAKKRAVEPVQLDVTPYAPLLPATVLAVTLYGISITTSLAVANNALANLQVAPNG